MSICAFSRSPRMTGGFKGLILLSLCLVVWTVPIDRKQDPPQEEKPEENAVRLVSDQEHVMCVHHLVQYWHALLFMLYVYVSGHWSVLWPLPQRGNWGVGNRPSLQRKTPDGQHRRHQGKPHSLWSTAVKSPFILSIELYMYCTFIIQGTVHPKIIYFL